MNLKPQTITALADFAQPAVKAGLVSNDELKAAVKILRQAANGEKETLQLLTTKQVASKLGVCVKTVLRMSEDGLLSRIYLRPGAPKTLRFNAMDIERIGGEA